MIEVGINGDGIETGLLVILSIREVVLGLGPTTKDDTIIAISFPESDMSLSAFAQAMKVIYIR